MQQTVDSSNPSPELEPYKSPASVEVARDEEFFQAHSASKDLGKRTIRGSVVTLSAQGAKFALKIGSTAILARLLTPTDFGLVAMVTVITSFIEMFKEAGLSMAVVQQEKVTHEQVSTLFWINVVIGCVLTFVIAALSPAIAWFYGEPRLLSVTLALSCTTVFGAIAVQHQAILRRNMHFGRLMAIDLLSLIAGIAVAVSMGYLDFAYWSLVGMIAATVVTTALLGFVLSGWRPGKPRRGTGVRSMLAFGGNITGANLANQLYRSADKVLLAWWHGPDVAGAYSRAWVIVLQPMQQLIAPLASVLEPVLCRAVNDVPRFRSIYLTATCLAWFIACYGGVLIYVFAPVIVYLVLGEGWAEVIDVLRAFSVATTCLVFGSIVHRWLLLPLGMASRVLRWMLIQSTLGTIAYFVFAPYGMVAVAWSISVIELVSGFTAIYILSFGTIVPARRIYVALIPGLSAVAIAAGLYFYTTSGSPDLVTFLVVSVPFVLIGLGVVNSRFARNLWQGVSGS
ncbi:lipopolysaccharide biosynthesis protein [Blastopirellula marina]|uniref:lipopolysaccharide biosynthesis protein n=1 Tax=Blastopirellula marina TaxID=124 RepID=UPI001304F113|nr:lipopolysaccharide biosynthesis protein [Blastopirellula marina]